MFWRLLRSTKISLTVVSRQFAKKIERRRAGLDAFGQGLGVFLLVRRRRHNHPTSHHRSVITALSWRADTRTASPNTLPGESSPEPLPPEHSTATAASSVPLFTPAGRHRHPPPTTSSAIPTPPGPGRTESAAQRRQNGSHQSATVFYPAVSPTVRTRRPALSQPAVSPTSQHTGQLTGSPAWLPQAASSRLPPPAQSVRDPSRRNCFSPDQKGVNCRVPE